MRFLSTLALLFAITVARAADDSTKVYPPAYLALLRDAARSFSHRDFVTAVALVDKADTLSPPTPVSLNIRGAVAIEEKRYDEGRKFCIDALNLEPTFFPARFNLAEIPFVKGKYPEARIMFEKLLEDNPNEDLLKFRIFLTYLLEKNEDAAKERLEKIPFLSDSPVYYYCQAAWEFTHGNEKEARGWVDRGNWVFPPNKTQNFADVFYDLGWLKRPVAGAAD